MSSEQLMHIFDNSSCLTRKQLQAYAADEMISEEAHAAEVHLNTCPFCRMGIEGLQLGDGYAIESISELNSRFLKDHLSINNPQIHLNSIAAAVPHQPSPHIARHKKGKKTVLLTPWTVSVAFLLVIGAWYMEFGRSKTQPVTSMPARQNAIPVSNNESVKTENNQKVKSVGDYSAVANNTKPARAIRKQKQTIVTTAAYIQERPSSTNENTASSNNQSLTISNTSEKPLIEEKKKVSPAVPSARKGVDEVPAKQNTAAIGTSKQTIKNEDKATRHDAALSTAESYVNSGKNEKAIPLLKQIIDEGGPRKHAAKRLMRQIKRDEQVNID